MATTANTGLENILRRKDFLGFSSSEGKSFVNFLIVFSSILSSFSIFFSTSAESIPNLSTISPSFFKRLFSDIFKYVCNSCSVFYTHLLEILSNF